MHLKRLPVGCTDGLLVRRWDSEAHWGHHSLIPCGTDHLPLGPLRVVLQHTLLTPINGDLRADRCKKWMEMSEMEVNGEILKTTWKNRMEKKKGCCGIKADENKRQMGKKTTIIKIKQTQKWQTNKKPKRTPNATQKIEVSRILEH